MQGKLKVDEYVTHHRTLEDIDQGFHDMHASCFFYMLASSFTNPYVHNRVGIAFDVS
jgi:hypothetical protein